MVEKAPTRREAERMSSILVVSKERTKVARNVSFNKVCMCSDGTVRGLFNDPSSLKQNILLKLGTNKGIFLTEEKSSSSEMSEKMPTKNVTVKKKPSTILKPKIKCKVEGCKVTFTRYGKAIENHMNQVHRGDVGKKDQTELAESQFLPTMASTQAVDQESQQGRVTLDEVDEESSMAGKHVAPMPTICRVAVADTDQHAQTW